MSPDIELNGRTHLDVVKAQIEAIEAWNRAHRVAEAAACAGSMSREMRLDLSRRIEARRREQAAIIARVDAQLRASGTVLHHEVPVRAVVAHRNAWMTQKITELLAARKVQVVGAYDDGADAVGTVVAEQPDLVIVEDRLSTLTGIDVVRRIRQYSPLSLVAAQALDSSGVAALVDAGAHAVFTRRIPPADIVEESLHVLQGDVASLRTLTLV